jgi:hypothetical protein
MKTIVELKTKGKQWNQKRLKKAIDDCLLIEKVINTGTFRDEVLQEYMTNTNGLTNLEIYNLIMLADEKMYNGLEEENLNVMNIEYNLIKRSWLASKFSKVIGYGYATDNKINTYVDAFDRLDVYSLAGHLAHEALHKYGWNDSAKEKTSVTYVVGFIIRDLAREMK